MKNFLIYLSISILIIIFFILPINKDENILPIPSSDQQTVLNIWVQDAFPVADSYFNELQKRYNSNNPEFQIIIDVIQGTDTQVYNHISERILNGNEPDILLLSLNNYNAFVTERKLYPINEYFNKYDKDYFIPSVYRNGYYNEELYGLAYYIDPEVIVYKNKDIDIKNLSQILPLNDTQDLLNNLLTLNENYLLKDYSNEALSIPSMTKDGKYIFSFIGNDWELIKQDEDILNMLQQLYNKSRTKQFDYAKSSSHSFFTGNSSFSIEPLSLIYREIETDYRTKEQLDILEISKQLSMNSNMHYISIYNNSLHKDNCEEFLDSFLSELEIVNRYRFYKIPIICNSKKNLFVNDNRYNNQNVWNYLHNALHYEISSDANSLNQQLDEKYELYINKP